MINACLHISTGFLFPKVLKLIGVFLSSRFSVVRQTFNSSVLVILLVGFVN